jgi:hypothetical protein
MHRLSKHVRAVVTTALLLGFGSLVLGDNTAEASLQKRYPRIRAALVELKAARQELKDAGVNFGGHKKKAIDALDVAIEELGAAIAWADRNGSITVSLDAFDSGALASLQKKFPRLRAALVEIRAARQELKDAGVNFGGHKKKAIDALDVAIVELGAAIKWADEH